MTRGVLRQCFQETAEITGMIFLILIGSAVFNYFIETAGLPQLLISQVEALGLSPMAVLLLVLLFYIVLGCFMDALSMILLTVPFVVPMVATLGFDLVWFGVIIVTVAELGLITPPVGMNLFVIQGVVSDLSIQTIVKGVVPFLAADIVRLAILIAFPALVLWLPRLAGF